MTLRLGGNPVFRIAILWAVISAAVGMVAYEAWIRGAYHRDFYPRWAGARLALFEHRDPYAAETTREMQQLLYGHPLPPSADQQGFAYPAILLVDLLPFWFFDDVQVATAIWVGFSFGLMLLGLGLLRSEGNPPWWAVGALLGWYFPLLMLFQGQFDGFVLATLALSLWAWEAKRDALAGALLTLGLIKPQLVLLPVGILLWQGLRERRWWFLLAFVAVNAAVLALSVALVGWWPPRWLAALGRYQHYARVFSAVGWLWQRSPWLAVLGMAGLSAALYTVRASPRWLIAAAVPVGLLLFPQTLIWSQTMLLLPLTVAWSERTRWWIGILWVCGWLSLGGHALFPGYWWQVQATVFPLCTLGIVLAAHGLGDAGERHLQKIRKYMRGTT